MPKAKVTSKGQVTIPLRVRKQLGIDAGSYVNFEPTQDGFKLKAMAIDTLDSLPNVFSYSGPGVSIEEMNDAVIDMVADSYRKSL
jgi:AbrB family looped-hinge helix DNA binding protein